MGGWLKRRAAAPEGRGFTPAESVRDQWFVALMVNACEEVLTAAPEDAAWRAVLLDQLRLHRAHFEGPAHEPAQYSAPMRALIGEMLAEP